jgi:hypothetical protein
VTEEVTARGLDTASNENVTAGYSARRRSVASVEAS